MSLHTIPDFHEVWLKALDRHGISIEGLAAPKMKTKRDGRDDEEESRDADSSGNEKT